MFVLNDGKNDIPKLWYEFRHRVHSENDEKKALKIAEKEKDAVLQEKLSAKRKRAAEIYDVSFKRPSPALSTPTHAPPARQEALPGHRFDPGAGKGFVCEGCDRSLIKSKYCRGCYKHSGFTFCEVCHGKRQK